MNYSELKIDGAIQERKMDNTSKFSFSVFKMNVATFCSSYSSVFFLILIFLTYKNFAFLFNQICKFYGFLY